jgi:hypothetical protein
MFVTTVVINKFHSTIILNYTIYKWWHFYITKRGEEVKNIMVFPLTNIKNRNHLKLVSLRLYETNIELFCKPYTKVGNFVVLFTCCHSHEDINLNLQYFGSITVSPLLCLITLSSRQDISNVQPDMAFKGYTIIEGRHPMVPMRKTV